MKIVTRVKNKDSNLFLFVDEFDRDDCYHDEDGESIDEDVINEIRKIYDKILEKKIPTYPDLSLGEFLSTESDHYLQLKQFVFHQDEINQREKVFHWLNKQHSYLNLIGCEKLTEVSVQGKICHGEKNWILYYCRVECF
jgi:hypothetical protein